MNIDEPGLTFIKDFEGFEPTSKDDGFGTLTVGYGHTNLNGTPPRVVPGLTITEPQADSILDGDLAPCVALVNSLVPNVNQDQLDALVSFQFNTGAFARSNVLASIRAGKLQDVPGDLRTWVYADRKYVPGLMRRRVAEGVLFEGRTQTAEGLTRMFLREGIKMPKRAEMM